MIGTSFRTRSVIFAHLLGPPRLLSRKEGIEIYDGVCKALGVDDLTFKYSSLPLQSGSGIGPELGPIAERSSGFSMEMERRLGRGAFKVVVANQSLSQPILFRIAYTWPPSREHVHQEFDAVAESVFEALGQGFMRVMAEARILGQVEAQGGNAVGFVVDRCLRLNQARLAELESPLVFAGLHLETKAGDPIAEDQLRQPKREIKVEVLRDDPRAVYLEVMSQWAQLAISPTADGTVQIDEQMIRRIAETPSKYIANTLEFLTDRVLPLFETEQT